MRIHESSVGLLGILVLWTGWCAIRVLQRTQIRVSEVGREVVPLETAADLKIQWKLENLGASAIALQAPTASCGTRVTGFEGGSIEPGGSALFETWTLSLLPDRLLHGSVLIVSEEGQGLASQTFSGEVQIPPTASPPILSFGGNGESRSTHVHFWGEAAPEQEIVVDCPAGASAEVVRITPSLFRIDVLASKCDWGSEPLHLQWKDGDLKIPIVLSGPPTVHPRRFVQGVEPGPFLLSSSGENLRIRSAEPQDLTACFRLQEAGKENEYLLQVDRVMSEAVSLWLESDRGSVQVRVLPPDRVEDA